MELVKPVKPVQSKRDRREQGQTRHDVRFLKATINSEVVRKNLMFGRLLLTAPSKSAISESGNCRLIVLWMVGTMSTMASKSHVTGSSGGVGEVIKSLIAYEHSRQSRLSLEYCRTSRQFGTLEGICSDVILSLIVALGTGMSSPSVIIGTETEQDR